MLKDILY